jgi:hypothetical protein
MSKQNKLKLLVYVRVESRTFYHLHPCLCSSGVENPPLLDSLFMFEWSRELFTTCILVYVRAESRTFYHLHSCLCSSGVENPALHVYVRAKSRTFFVRQQSPEPCPILLHLLKNPCGYIFDR